ncbi:MAG: hypothetical protein BWY76_03250 [bacterium ADurb.Bin429]|nr:MAG: hypothetical protein BWY76_03250 [bacterium ADurb.Bin429]
MRGIVQGVCLGLILVGVLVALHWTKTFQLPLSGTLLMNALPILTGAIFGLFLGILRPPRPVFYVTGLKLCLAVALIYGVGATTMELVYRSWAPTRDLRHYAIVREKFWKHDLDAVAHFPTKMPANAERLFLFAVRYGLHETGPIMQLRYSTSAKDIAAKEQDYQRQQITAPRPKVFLLAGEQHPLPMPRDFEIYQLPPTPSASRPYAGYVQQRGVAISRERGEIVYWAQERKLPKVKGDRRAP